VARKYSFHLSFPKTQSMRPFIESLVVLIILIPVCMYVTKA
jgi:hypothetical protein